MNQIDFRTINQTALSQAESLCRDWLPGGKRVGNEYVCADETGGNGRSFTVNLTKGVWKDFATGIGGADMISLYALVKGLSQAEAARELDDALQAGGIQPAESRPDKNDDQVYDHAPDDAPPHPDRHYKFGKPSNVWTWYRENGRIAGYTMRFDLPDGSKQFSQISWGKSGKTGREQWLWKAMAKLRPLYRLPELLAEPDKPVILVEGEKCADRLAALVERSIATTWPGGANAINYVDWQPLRDRSRVVIIPDNDKPGYKAAMQIRAMIGSNAQIYYLPAGLPEGHDVADMSDEEVTALLSGDGGNPDPRWIEVAEHVSEPDPEPDPDYVPEPPERHSDCVDETDFPFLLLGFDRGEYFYMPHQTQQVITLSAAQHQKANLLMLAPLAWWEDNFPASKAPVDWTMAANEMIQASHRKGIYSPDRIRGRGCWIEWEDGKRKIIYHTGSDLIIDGEPVPLTSHKSHYIYERAACVMPDIANPAGDGASRAFLRLVRSLNWKHDLYAHLLAGWCALAPVCGVLNWRPHAWISGPAGSGKTWVIHNVVLPMVGNLAMSIEGQASEAGIRQEIGNDAKPVVIDEFESETSRDAQRIQEVLTLARSASSSSNSAIIKGSASGKTTKYYVRSMFLFGSIGVAATQRADITRIASLELVAGDPHRFHQVISPLAAETVMKTGFCESIRARILANAATIHRNIETFVQAVTAKVKDRRLGDQLGTLVAGAWALYSTDQISAEDAAKWVDQHDWSVYIPSDTETDENRCLAILVNAQIIVEDTTDQRPHTVRRTIGECLGYLADWDHTKDKTQRDDYMVALERNGIRFFPDDSGGKIAISNVHSELRRIYADTPYADKWKDQFARLDKGQVKGSVTARINKTPQKVTWILASRFSEQEKLSIPDDNIPF